MRYPIHWLSGAGCRRTLEVWLSVPLHISRKRVHLVAPGVCSYVAASCGGALGRLCLTTGEEQDDMDEEPERVRWFSCFFSFFSEFLGRFWGFWMGDVVRNFWNNFWKILELVPIPDDKMWDFKGIARNVFGEGEDVTKTCVISWNHRTNTSS